MKVPRPILVGVLAFVLVIFLVVTFVPRLDVLLFARDVIEPENRIGSSGEDWEDEDAAPAPVTGAPMSVEAKRRAHFIKRIQRDVAIGILTTGKMHSRLASAVESWYDLKEFGQHDGFVTIFTDSDDGTLPSGDVVPNVKNTGCESTYNYGLWCKNTVMWKYWREDARFKNVKWFVRIMDDSYVHLENLLDLVKQYNSSHRIVLGDKHCYWSNHDYPSGGPGVLFSRGTLEDFNMDDWEKPYKAARNMGSFFDDVAWGDYLYYRKIPVTNHMGIEQAANRPYSPQYRYWLEFQRGKGLRWNLPYRPVMLHQHGNPMPMSEVHKQLHNIDYFPLADKLIDIPPCHCPNSKHQKCIWNQELTDRGHCHWGFDRLNCIAPGPWDLPKPDLPTPPQQS